MHTMLGMWTLEKPCHVLCLHCLERLLGKSIICCDIIYNKVYYPCWRGEWSHVVEMYDLRVRNYLRMCEDRLW